VEQLEKGRDLDTNNPAVWNQLANFQGHNGATTNAFTSYEKAIRLDPREAVYYWNFATTVYLYRKDAMAHYHITEQQVFDKALNLYVKALQLDPTNFVLAADLAQTYYGIRPVRTDEALNAYTNALSLARDEIEREGIYIHLARFKYNAGRFAQARAHLDAVTNAMYADLKKLLARNLAEKELSAKETNRPPAATTNTPVNAGVSQPQSATNKSAPVVENPK
jgi:cytochrome c-type biogenesis protein CcmH/NrfG